MMVGPVTSTPPSTKPHSLLVAVLVMAHVLPFKRGRSGSAPQRQSRAEHPAFAAGDRSLAAVPALLLRWGIKQFDADTRSPVVIGNTVVSSVNRGPADLTFSGRPVVLTAGYPALSPMMGLTHGVHGIGDTIAISVHAAESAVDNVDEYVDRLHAALSYRSR